MKFKILLIFIHVFFCSSSIYSQVSTTEKLTAESNFEIKFFDTTFVKTIKVKCEYDSEKKGKEYKVILIDSDSASKTDTFELDKTVNFYVFESEFNRTSKKIFKFSKTIATTSIQEVYRMVWNMNHPGGDGTEAGILQFNQQIMIMNSQSDSIDYPLRRKIKVDNWVNNKIVDVSTNTKNAKDTLSKYKTKLEEEKKTKAIAEWNKDNLPPILNNNIEKAIAEALQKDTNYKLLEKQYQLKQKQEADILIEFYKQKIYKINQIELQFERGFLEHIKVWVNMNNADYIFENIYAVGFSSAKNFRQLYKTRLYIRNSELEDAPFIILGDVFRNYDNRLDNYTRDYCPADTTFKIDPGTTYQIVLHREKFINLFDAKIYSDLKGTNQNNPNGLFQIDVSKRFNVHTIRYQVGNTRTDWGYFSYLEPWGILNKIEQHNRSLTLHNANITQNGILTSPNYATNLDFTRYENYSAGLNLNGFLVDRPDQKFTLYADVGIKYGHVIINDSVLTPTGLKKNNNPYPEGHTVTFQLPKITFEFFAESRINLRFSYALNKTLLFSNNAFKQIASYDKSDVTTVFTEQRATWFNQYEALLKIAPSKEKNTHFFVRFRFYTQNGDANTSFSQLQIGYAYNWSIAR